MTSTTGNIVTTLTPTNNASVYGDMEVFANTLAASVQALDAQFSATPVGKGAISAVAGLVPIVNNKVGTVTVVSGGSGYTTAPAVTLSGDVGNADAVLTAVLAAGGSIKSVTVGGSGTGYKFNDPLVFTGGAGSNAAGYAVTDYLGNITGCVITNGGTGYTSAPSVAVTTAGGSGNTLTAVVGKAVASVTVTGAGSGFAAAPKLTFAAPSGTGGHTATGKANLTANVAVCVLTLAAPVAGLPSAQVLVSSTPDVYAPGQDGQSIFVFDTVGAAHTVTTPASALNGASHIATFGGDIGDSIKLVAYKGVWYVAGSTGVTLS
jgi:hypothetical protein